MRRNWIPSSVSTTLHLLLIAAAVTLSRKPAGPAPERPSDAAERGRHVDMIYIPPVEPPRPSPTRRPVAPPPVKSQKEPEPEPNAPPAAIRTSGADSDDPSQPKGEAAPQTPPRRPEAVIATLESEARRIFGRARPRTAPGAGPQATRPMEAYLPDNPERCVPRPATPRRSGDTAQFGTVVGRIFKQDSGRPLAGAHLQMLGAPYVAFTDNAGEYRFRFDLALVDNCRTQYVRVTAPGYETRLLVLVMGESIQSEDVRLRRR